MSHPYKETVVAMFDLKGRRKVGVASVCDCEARFMHGDILILLLRAQDSLGEGWTSPANHLPDRRPQESDSEG